MSHVKRMLVPAQSWNIATFEADSSKPVAATCVHVGDVGYLMGIRDVR